MTNSEARFNYWLAWLKTLLAGGLANAVLLLLYLVAEEDLFLQDFDSEFTMLLIYLGGIFLAISAALSVPIFIGLIICHHHRRSTHWTAETYRYVLHGVHALGALVTIAAVTVLAVGSIDMNSKLAGWMLMITSVYLAVGIYFLGSVDLPSARYTDR